MTDSNANPTATADDDLTATSTPHEPPERLRLLSELRARHRDEPQPTELPPHLPVTAVKRHEALFQPRRLDPRHLHLLGQVLKTRQHFDPLTVIQIGREPVLVDGHHRWTAYEKANVSYPVPVTYFAGTVAEAMLAAGAENQKAKLPMTGRERMDRAWTLVTMGVFSKTQEADGSGVSKAQIAIMRGALKQLRGLGLDPSDYDSWWRAQQASKGKDAAAREWSDDWREELADKYVQAIQKAVGSKLSDNPEVAALALEKYFGHKLEEVMQHLPAHAPEEEEDDEDTPF